MTIPTRCRGVQGPGDARAHGAVPDELRDVQRHRALLEPVEELIDVLACVCGARLRFIATIEDPPVVTKILAHLGSTTESPALMPARPPPQPDGFEVA